MSFERAAIEDRTKDGFADFLLQTIPVGIIVMDDKLNIIYRNGEGNKFLKRYGLPREVPRIGGRILDAFESSRLNELFPGEVYIEKRLGNSTSKWLFKLHMVEERTPLIVVFIIEEAVPNQLNMGELRLRYRLTRRETDVLRRVLRGLKNADIADELSISGQTIKDHLSHIYAKIGIGNRSELMSIFIAPRGRE